MRLSNGFNKRVALEVERVLNFLMTVLNEMRKAT
jgi:hypothetical protein